MKRAGPGQKVMKPGSDYFENYGIGDVIGPDEHVFLATNKDNELEYVSRAIEKRDMPIQDSQDIEDHFSVLAGLDHAHICRFVEAFDNDERIHMIYEKAKPVSIFEEEPELRQGKPLHIEACQHYCRHLAAALRVAHKQGVAHGRLNETSLLVDPHAEDEDGKSVKICDMGQTFIARQLRIGEKLQYEAPEALWKDVPVASSMMHFRANFKTYQHVDMWSFGVIMFKMLTGKLPFPRTRADELTKAIKEEIVEFGSEWKKMPEAKDLVSGLLKKEGRIRMSAEKVLKHPWIMLSKEKVSKSKMYRVLQNVMCHSSETTFKKFCLRVIAEDMSPEKMEVVVKAFRLIDKNGDGTLEVHEITAVLKKFGEEEGLAGEIFEAIDRDASGTLNFAEFTAVSIGPSEYSDKETLWHCFNRFDKDGNGGFDRAEIGTVVREVEHLNEATALAAEVEEIAQDVEMPMDFETFVHHMTTPVGKEISTMKLGWDRFCNNVFKVDTHGVKHITPKQYDHAATNMLKKSPYAKNMLMSEGGGGSPQSKKKKKVQQFESEVDGDQDAEE